VPLTRFGWIYWQNTLFVSGSVSPEFDLREPINAYFVEVEYQHLTPVLLVLYFIGSSR